MTIRISSITIKLLKMGDKFHKSWKYFTCFHISLLPQCPQGDSARITTLTMTETCIKQSNSLLKSSFMWLFCVFCLFLDWDSRVFPQNKDIQGGLFHPAHPSRPLAQHPQRKCPQHLRITPNIDDRADVSLENFIFGIMAQCYSNTASIFQKR